MARPIKEGFDYFPLDVDFFQDIKIRKLIKYQGEKAVSVLICLLCNIYKQGYYIRWDKDLAFVISEQSGCKEVFVSEILKNCLNIGIFSKQMFDEKQVFTSIEIQNQYKIICENAKRKVIKTEFFIVNTELTLVNSEETPVNTELTLVNTELSTQSKVKERKVKENIKINNKKIINSQVTIPPTVNLQHDSEQVHTLLPTKEKEKYPPAPQPPQKKKVTTTLDFSFLLSYSSIWTQIMQEWVTYKEATKSPVKLQISLQKSFTNLLKISDNDPEVAQAIVDQSIASSYQGLFPLKQNANNQYPTGNTQYPASNNANNANKRADSDAIERKKLFEFYENTNGDILTF